MTCPPTLADLNRTVIKATPVDQSSGWWTGLVCDRRGRTGEVRFRLERYPADNSRNRPVQTWRVRRDFWTSEREAVAHFNRFGGDRLSGVLPIDDFYTPKKHLSIREDQVRRVEVVEIETEWGRTSTRLYHWDPVDGSTKQKWTIGKEWERLSNLATRTLEGDQ